VVLNTICFVWFTQPNAVFGIGVVGPMSIRKTWNPVHRGCTKHRIELYYIMR